MARRVAALVLVLALAPAVSWGGAAPRSGISDALLSRWERATDRLDPHSPDRGERYFRALALQALGQEEEARALLSELSATEGPFGGAALEAVLPPLFRAGRYLDVTRLFEKARSSRFQDRPLVLYQAGQSYFLLHRDAEASAALQGVTEGPLAAYALYTRAQLAQASGRVLEGVELLGSAIEAVGKSPAGEVPEALADWLRVTRGRLLYKAAVAANGATPPAREKLFAPAVEQLSRVGRGSVFYPEALRAAGWCAAEVGDSARALGAFAQAAELAPEGRHEDLWAQGRVFQRLGFFDEAARFYAEAQREASRAAERAPAAGGDDTATLWRLPLERAAGLRNRLGLLEAEQREVGASLDRRRAAVEDAKVKLTALIDAPRGYLAELGDLEKNLVKYLDAASASALFPLSERPRLDSVLARQDRVLRELTTLEEVVIRLTESGAWTKADDRAVRSAQGLWRRLGDAKASLSRSQLAFLEGLKGRVSAREEELSRAIEGRRAEVASVQPGGTQALRALDGERLRLASVGSRVEELVRRHREVAQRLDALEAELKQARAQALASAAGEAAARLRRKADGYALDEAEALQLWGEKGRDAGTGSRP